MTYRGEVKGGVIILEPGVQLPDGTVVSVEPVAAQRPHADDPLRQMTQLAMDAGVSDLATNIDHYLYGHPKVDDAR